MEEREESEVWSLSNQCWLLTYFCVCFSICKIGIQVSLSLWECCEHLGIKTRY